jgi:hypothetical protein
MQEFNDTVSACAHNPVLVRMLEQSRVFSRPGTARVAVCTRGRGRDVRPGALDQPPRAGTGAAIRATRSRRANSAWRTRRAGPCGSAGHDAHIDRGRSRRRHRHRGRPGRARALAGHRDRFDLRLDFEQLRLRQAPPTGSATARCCRRTGLRRCGLRRDLLRSAVGWPSVVPDHISLWGSLPAVPSGSSTST